MRSPQNRLCVAACLLVMCIVRRRHLFSRSLIRLDEILPPAPAAAAGGYRSVRATIQTALKRLKVMAVCGPHKKERKKVPCYWGLASLRGRMWKMQRRMQGGSNWKLVNCSIACRENLKMFSKTCQLPTVCFSSAGHYWLIHVIYTWFGTSKSLKKKTTTTTTNNWIKACKYNFSTFQ